MTGRGRLAIRSCGCAVPKRLTATKRDLEAIRAAVAHRAMQMRDWAEPRVRINKGPKNHSVNRRRHQQAMEKNRRIKARIAKQREVISKFNAQARAYWRGECPEHP
jgi:hypothetical protein